MLTALKKCKFLLLLVLILLFAVLQVSAEGLEDSKGFGSQQEIEEGELLVYFIDGQQQVLASPIVEFPLLEVSFQAQISSSMLAHDQRRVRVDNATPHNIQLSIAPHLETGNFVNDARWVSGSRSYPIFAQNPAHGKLEINPVNSTLTALGCDASRVNLGSNTGFLFIEDFHEDNVESIDIFTTIDGGMCRFDLEGVDLKQVIPAFQSPREHDYELQMVLTVTIAEIGEDFGCGGIFVDSRDEKQYGTVEMGSQCWMMENLNYDSGCSSVAWEDNVDEGWCGYYDDEGTPLGENGFLYQWSAAMDWDGEGTPPSARHQGVCPEGWVMPSDEDWIDLEESLEMCTGTDADCSGAEGWRNSGDVGTKLATWTDNGEGTNETGFTALATGYRSSSGSFDALGTHTGFWTSSSLEADSWRRLLGYEESGVARDPFTRAQAYSVRCVSDEIYTINYVSSNGGSVSPASRSVVHRGTSEAPEISPNHDHDFFSFSIISGEGHGELDSMTGEVANVTGNMTVRANFLIKKYTITYNTTEGGSVYPTSREVNYGATAAAPSIGYINPSYVFVGFSLQSGHGNGVFNAETGEIADVTGEMTVLATFELTPDPCEGQMYYVDSRDGQVYDIIRAGEQCWMAQNLNYDANCAWRALRTWEDTRACRCYDNSTTNCDAYGRLYQHRAALAWDGSGELPPSGERQGACPNGWFFASNEDWKELEVFLGMSYMIASKGGLRTVGSVGEKLKATPIDPIPWDGTNILGFNLTAGGAMWATAPFWNHPGGFEYRWLGESVQVRDSDGYSRSFSTEEAGSYRYGATTQIQYSLLYMRCVKTLD